jgi:Rhs element Vgr protein
MSTPAENKGSLVTISVLNEGQQINSYIHILSIRVRHEVNRVSSAVIELIDGDISGQDFPVSNLPDFLPGKKITIQAGYNSVDAVIFDGIIIRHSVKCKSDGFTLMTIECRNDAVKMTVGRKNAMYTDSTDSDLIGAVIGTYGMSPTIDATSIRIKEVVQYYSTDWDFILSRAEANGMIVTTFGSDIHVVKPNLSATPILSVAFGDSIHEFDLDIDARYQYSSVKGVSWNQATQQVALQDGSAQSLNVQGNLSAGDLSTVIGLTSLVMQTDAPTQEDTLKSWADAQLLKSELSRIRGTISFQGNSLLMPGDMLEILGIGERFSGNAFVGSITHTIGDGEWATEAGIGLSEAWFSERKNIAAPLATGLLPGIQGLHIGIVTQLDQDPNGEYMVQVSLPIMQSKVNGVWARLNAFYHSNGFGSFFLPEISDEVIVGFLNNDPSHPVILGSVYSSKNKPPYEFTAENNIKAIVTRSKIRIEMDEDKKILTIQTPANNKIVLNDDQKSILISDQNNNTIEMNTSGISLDSPKDIVVSAKGKISLSALNNIEINAKANVDVSALNISNNAQVGFTGKGNATAELSAAGQTTVKGALVLIN